MVIILILVVSLLLLFVGIRFLPLGIQIVTFASFAHVKLRPVLFGLKSLPLSQSHGLGLLFLSGPPGFFSLVGSHGFGVLGVGGNFGVLDRSIGLVLFGLHLILVGTPIVGSTALLLVNRLDT